MKGQGGDEETLKVVLYMLIMVVVIYVGIGLVLGFNPTDWAKKLSSVKYEPGKIQPTQQAQALSDITLIDCSESAQSITLKDIKFRVAPGTESSNGELKFIVATIRSWHACRRYGPWS